MGFYALGAGAGQQVPHPRAYLTQVLSPALVALTDQRTVFTWAISGMGKAKVRTGRL